MRSPRVLLVDDEPDNLLILEIFLKKITDQIVLCKDPREVKGLFEKENFDLAILDISMPHIDGIEICKWIKSDVRFSDCCVIFSTAIGSEQKLEEALEAGATDYLVKPIKRHELISRAKAGIRLKRGLDEVHRTHALHQADFLRLKRKNAELESALDQLRVALEQVKEVQSTVLFSLSKLAESRDNETGKHLLRTQKYVELVAKHLQSKDSYKSEISDDYIKNLVQSAPLHDIGKVGIPDHILRKQGRLTDSEFELMKEHTVIGANTLKEAASLPMHSDFLDLAIEISHFHHEKNDGTGYPEGLKGEQIPLSARIMSLADIYDALRCRRCYKEPIEHKRAKEMIIKDNGLSFFHPDVLNAFEVLEKEFESISIELHDD